MISAATPRASTAAAFVEAGHGLDQSRFGGAVVPERGCRRAGPPAITTADAAIARPDGCHGATGGRIRPRLRIGRGAGRGEPARGVRLPARLPGQALNASRRRHHPADEGVPVSAAIALDGRQTARAVVDGPAPGGAGGADGDPALGTGSGPATVVMSYHHAPARAGRTAPTFGSANGRGPRLPGAFAVASTRPG